METKTTRMKLGSLVALLIIIIYHRPVLGLALMLLPLLIVLGADFERLFSILRFILPKIRKFILDKGVSCQRRSEWAAIGLGYFYVAFTYNRLSRRVLSLARQYVIRFITRMRNKLKQRRAYCCFQASTASTPATSRWSEEVLPQDIMLLILQRLWISDYIRCRAVCVSWRAAVDRAIASKCCPPAPQFPWLVLWSYLPLSKDHSFISPSERKVYTSFPSVYRRECVGSIDGWLIMVDSSYMRPEGFTNPYTSPFYVNSVLSHTIVNSFLNPISGAQVMLPSQSTIPCRLSSWPLLMKKAVASSEPTRPHSCVVATICEEGRLAFCRPTDKSWTLIKEEEAISGLNFSDIEILDGKLYATTANITMEGQEGFLLVFDIQYLEEEEDPTYAYTAQRLVMLPPMQLFRSSMVNIPQGVGSMYDVAEEYPCLAKDPTSKELFVIFRAVGYSCEQDPIIPLSHIGGAVVIPPKVKGFRVFKLEYCINNIHAPRLVEIGDLGDRILFVSKASNKLISSAAATNGLNLKTVQANSIYFAFHYPCLRAPLTGSDFGVFSLTNKIVQPLTFKKDCRPIPLTCRTTWFTPTP